MEYVYYVLFIFAVLAACIYLVRLPGHRRLSGRPVALADRSRRHRAHAERRKAGKSLKRDREFREHVLRRDITRVPVPWGWPGHGGRHDSEQGTDGVSASLHRWVDHLVREKRTVDDDEFISRKAASMRALLEGRYGRANSMSQMSYHKIKAPLLRDPSSPHDQMDNFPSGKTAQITRGISPQPVSPGGAAINIGSRKVANLRNLRTPWGW